MVAISLPKLCEWHQTEMSCCVDWNHSGGVSPAWQAPDGAIDNSHKDVQQATFDQNKTHASAHLRSSQRIPWYQQEAQRHHQVQGPQEQVPAAGNAQLTTIAFLRLFTTQGLYIVACFVLLSMSMELLAATNELPYTQLHRSGVRRAGRPQAC